MNCIDKPACGIEFVNDKFFGLSQFLIISSRFVRLSEQGAINWTDTQFGQHAISQGNNVLVADLLDFEIGNDVIEIQCGFGFNIGLGIERCEDFLNRAHLIKACVECQAYMAKPAVDPVVEVIV